MQLTSDQSPAQQGNRDQNSVLQELSKSIEQSRKECGIPGMAVAILFKGQLVFAEGFGIRNEQKQPFTPQTLSPIGSLTKAFTATMIGELVAEGKMDWNKTPVNKYLPEFDLQDPAWTRELTISDLLSHQTGLPSTSFLFHRNQHNRRETVRAFQDLVLPTNRPHVSKYQYDNSMYVVAGEAAVAASGIDSIEVEDLIRVKVLEPLEMHNTGFSPKEMKKRAPNNHARAFFASTLEQAKDEQWEPLALDEFYFASAAAGDIFSNVVDMVRWGKAIIDHGSVEDKEEEGEEDMNGEKDVGQSSSQEPKKKRRQVLNEKSVRETLVPKIITPIDLPRTAEFPLVTGYAFGWGVNSFKGQAYYRHGGAISGFSSYISMFPDSDLVIAQLYNITENQLSVNLTYHIADVLLDLPRTQDWLMDVAVKKTKESYMNMAKRPQLELPKQIMNTTRFHPNLEAYVGEYVNPINQEIVVRLEHGSQEREEKAQGEDGPRLVFKMWQVEKEFVHYHFDSFIMDLTDMSLRGRILATFQTGPMGKVDAILLGHIKEVSMLFKRKS